MGKRLIQQRRGKGSSLYKSNSHKSLGEIGYPSKIEGTVRGVVIDIFHSAGHTAPLMYVEYENGMSSLVPAPLGIRNGQEIMIGEKASASVGNILKLGNIPSASVVYNLELKPSDGGKLIRGSGSSAIVVAHQKDKVIVKLPSKKLVKLSKDCRATIGVIAGGGRKDKPLLKAGNKYHKIKARGGLYPKVSGVAMNAVDHPHGGTHRRTIGGPSSVSRHAPPGSKVGLISPKKTGRGK